MQLKNSWVTDQPWDVLVVGSGASGLMAALELPEQCRVLVVAKRSLHTNASRMAQAGIALASHSEDSLASHMEDTLRVGAGLCNASVVEQIILDSPSCKERLASLGVPFDRMNAGLSPALAAAHRYPRLLHVQDSTGAVLMDCLERHLRHKKNCTLLHGLHVLQLWIQDSRCIGIQAVLEDEVIWIRAGAVVLASGGGAHIFGQTTAPGVSVGDGIGLAWRAGAVLRDMEFVQFHPTAFKRNGVCHFLISEAVRGAGAQVVDSSGRDLLSSLQGGALASRDQVCRAMDQVMRSDHLENLWLDLRFIGREQLTSQFQSLMKRCRGHGIDPVTELVPVAPASHYWIGGVAINTEGATSVPGLYAIGEVASSGFHGASRLAGNSLLECLVLARRFARHVDPVLVGRSIESTVVDVNCSAGDLSEIELRARELESLCWRFAGVTRCSAELRACAGYIATLKCGEMQLPLLCRILGVDPGVDVHLLGEGLSNLLCCQAEMMSRLQLAELLFLAADHREESRGCHYRVDTPQARSEWCSHTVQQINVPIHSVPVCTE